VNDEHARGAAAHRRAEEDGVAASRGRRVRRDDPRSLLHREGFPGDRGLAHQEVGGLEHQAVRRHQLAGREQHHVSRDDGCGRDVALRAVAQHARDEGEALAQLAHGGRCAMLLGEAEQRARDDDRDDDAGIDPFAQRGGDACREDEDEDQRALELAQQEAQRALRRALRDVVAAEAREAPRGLPRGQALPAACEPPREFLGADRPERRVVRSCRHARVPPRGARPRGCRLGPMRHDPPCGHSSRRAGPVSRRRRRRGRGARRAGPAAPRGRSRRACGSTSACRRHRR